MSVPAPFMESCLMRAALELGFTFTPLCREHQVSTYGALRSLHESAPWHLLPETGLSLLCGLETLLAVGLVRDVTGHVACLVWN